LEGNRRRLIEVIFRHLEGQNRTTKPLSESRCPVRGSKWAFPEYKPEALPLAVRVTCSVPVDFSQPRWKTFPAAIGYEMRWDGPVEATCGDDKKSPRPKPGLRFSDCATSQPNHYCLCSMWDGDDPKSRDVSFTSHVVAATWQASRTGEGMEYMRKRRHQWALREGKTVD
jgi:hypothetical protein